MSYWEQQQEEAMHEDKTNGNNDAEECRMSIEIHTRKQLMKQSKGKFSFAAFPKAITKAAISLKRVRVTKDSTTQFAIFLLKVGALEVLRRGAKSRYPQLWWALQGLPLFQTPPLLWLRKWAPFRYFIEGTQMFSKPIICLSIATSISNIFDERTRNEDNFRSARTELPSAPASTPEESNDRNQVEQEHHVTLREELSKQGIDVRDRFSDDELQRFLVAANGSMKRFMSHVKKSVRWRENYYFLSSRELEEWSQFIYWHHRDAKNRPLLIIKLGYAYSTLVSDERPRFSQAIVSQIENGVRNLLNEEDPRITVILDCAGAPSMGFPLQMTKSCCVLVQENYPTRLAALFIVNLPQFVRVFANAIVQILKPATRQKVYLESENCAELLANHLGGMEWVPMNFGGSCKCSICIDARSAMEERRSEVNGHEQFQVDGGVYAREDNTLQSCTGLIRFAIIVLLMLWIVVALLASVYEPDLLALPT